MTKKICVYCGSKAGTNPSFSSIAEQLGQLFAKESIQLIYGGGKVGIMGIIADAVLNGGGYVQGVIPKSLMEKEVGHTGVQELHITQDMHSRKAMMESLSDAFIILPGGFGTLDELFEIVTWRQLGFHSKPVIILNVDGYFDHLLAFIDSAIQHEFINSNGRDIISVANNIDQVIQKVREL